MGLPTFRWYAEIQNRVFQNSQRSLLSSSIYPPLHACQSGLYLSFIAQFDIEEGVLKRKSIALLLTVRCDHIQLNSRTVVMKASESLHCHFQRRNRRLVEMNCLYWSETIYEKEWRDWRRDQRWEWVYALTVKSRDPRGNIAIWYCCRETEGRKRTG